MPLVFICLCAVTLVTPARAQSCCAGSSVTALTRLELHERLVLGAQINAEQLYGSHGGDGRFIVSPAQTAQTDVRQEVFATARAWERGEVTVIVPLVQSFRQAPGARAEAGVGLGDVELAARVALLRLHERHLLPAVAVQAALLVPTGRRIEDAELPLGSDATGGGVLRVSLGVALEYMLGGWLFSGSGSVEPPVTRHSNGVTSELATRWLIALGVGYQWSHRLSNALVGSHETESKATVDGVVVGESGARRSQLALASTLRLDDTWRLRAQVNGDLPLHQLAKNQVAQVGVTLGLVRSWL